MEPGAVFAGYTVEQVLGVGGMGTVYLAAHPRLPRKTALKLLHPGLTDDEYVRSRFEQEADHAARLEHPNIVAVHDRGVSAGQLWIAMQHIDGTDAKAELEHGPVAPDRAVYIVSETAKALDYAHEVGVLHRDVKPANILLEHGRSGRPGRVLLADFGIAKALSESTDQLTRTGMLVASLQYAAPEQFVGGELDHRTDVYSLGCTLFHLMTGQLPYAGTMLPQMMHAHLRSEIPKPSVVRPGLPRAMDAVIERALAKRPQDRFSSCGELAAAARAALRPEPSQTVYRQQPPPAFYQPAAVTQVRQAPVAQASPRSNKRPALILASVVGVLLLLTGFAVFALLPDNSKASASASAAAAPTIKVSNATVAEGNEGRADLVFAVEVTPAPTQAVTVDYATDGGTAIAGKDYDATRGTLEFAVGKTKQEIRVPVIGNSEAEGNKTVMVSLSNAKGAGIGVASAEGVITRSDGPPKTATHTVSIAKNGSGSVWSDPAGIDCGGKCAESYAPGTKVTFTARPDAGYRFDGWSGACSGTGACEVVTDSDVELTASFTANPVVVVANQYTLSVYTNGHGSGYVTGGGISCGSRCTGTYQSGTSVTLTAVPEYGSTFAGWSGACSGYGTCTVALNSAVSVTATFHQVAVTTTPPPTTPPVKTPPTTPPTTAPPTTPPVTYTTTTPPPSAPPTKTR
nr:protein kinase [Antrihabitans stalactiti]